MAVLVAESQVRVGDLARDDAEVRDRAVVPQVRQVVEDLVKRPRPRALRPAILPDRAPRDPGSRITRTIMPGFNVSPLLPRN